MDTKKELTKTSWTALIILIIVVFIMGGVIYWWQKKSVTEIPSDMSLPKPSAAPTSTSYVKPTATDETADWKTYTSEKYNFSIKYYPTWVYKEYETDKLSVAFGANNDALPKPQTDQPACIGVSVQPKVEDSQRTTDTSKMKKESISIGSVTATKITLSPGRVDDMYGDSKMVTVEISIANNEVIVIDNFADCQADIFNKMINTFKFLK